MTTESEKLVVEMGQLKWRCRRGMRELDQVTSGFLDTHYIKASTEERAAFRALLDLPDPELLALIFEHSFADDSTTNDVLAKMRNR